MAEEVSNVNQDLISEALSDFRESTGQKPQKEVVSVDKILETAKQVAVDFKNKAFETVNKFPNKLDFLQASFMGAVSVLPDFYIYALNSPNFPANEPVSKMLGTVMFGVVSVISKAGTVELFKAWHEKSFPKAEVQAKQ